MSGVCPADVLASVSSEFDRPLIQNNLRGLYVEHMVALLLGGAWRLTAGDWASWDLEHSGDGTRLQVKQSAWRQSWATESTAAKPRYDIRPAKGYYDGSRWVPEPGRHADIHIFGWHGEGSGAADHRQIEAWRFHVLLTATLPVTRSISLSTLEQMTSACDASQLAIVVDEHRAMLSQRQILDGPHHTPDA